MCSITIKRKTQLKMIYSEFERTNWSISQYNESTFDFIERSAWPIAGMVREFTNKFLDPFREDKEFISKLKSKSNQQHNAAMLELLLFALLKRFGLNIEKIERSIEKTPDFAISDEQGNNIYLECTLAANAMESIEERSRKESVMRFLEEIPDLPFYVSARFNSLSEQSISKKRLLHFIRECVSALGPNAGITQPSQEFTYDGQGWNLDISFITKLNKDHKRTAGVQIDPAKIIDNFSPLYSALNSKKPGRYNLGDHPYIICVGVDDMSADEYEFSESLFGQGMARDVYLDWPMQGFLLNNCEPINTSVSAVLFCKTLKEFSLESAKLSLWHNPYAKFPVPQSLIPVTQFHYKRENKRLMRNENVVELDLLKVLDIDAGEYIRFKNLEYRQVPKADR